jgi:hypothetical protein
MAGFADLLSKGAQENNLQVLLGKECLSFAV